ncbi:MAG: hypothetical protein ACRD2A_26400 [Vicinamibacterales bacterium]
MSTDDEIAINPTDATQRRPLLQVLLLDVAPAGGLVFVLRRNWPDLVIGLTIAAVAAYGGLQILRDAVGSRHGEAGSHSGHSHD